MGFCFGAAALIVHANRFALWSPVAWFLFAYGLFYGFGPLSYSLASRETVDYMDYLYPVSDQVLLQTNFLNAIGLVTVTISVWAVGAAKPVVFATHAAPARSISIAFALAFLIVGIPVKYFLLLPYNLGMYDFVVPALFKDLGQLTLAAVMILIALRKSLSRTWRVLLHVFIVSELVSAVVTLSKLTMLSVLMALMLGEYLRTRRIRWFLITGTGVLLLYALVLTPLVTVLRTTVSVRGIQDTTQAREATEAAGSIRETYADLHPNVQGWWSRLTYSNVQAFAMERYKAGLPGDSFGLIAWAPVPRALYPDKPEMTPGYDFTVEVYGRHLKTSTGLGVFAEAYWNGGWLFVCLAGMYMGVVFALVGNWSIRIVAAGKWYFAPALLNAVMIGLGITEWMAATYVGSVLYLLLTIVVIGILGKIIGGKRQFAQRRPGMVHSAFIAPTSRR